MKLTAFKFNLPKEQIALYPTKDRDGSKLMVLHRKDGKIEHKKFKNILDYFDEGDTFILNNTKVFPARMWGNKEKTGAKIEVFMLRELNRDSLLWDVIVDPARKIRIGNKLYFGKDDELVAEVIDNTTSRGRTLRFLFDGTYEEFKTAITEMGETPLPRYIKRETEAERRRALPDHLRQTRRRRCRTHRRPALQPRADEAHGAEGHPLREVTCTSAWAPSVRWKWRTSPSTRPTASK
jgi:S-adenosylmethionine:tRNA ribosyltransferase-isomerase